MRILLVDDERKELNRIAAALRDRGYECDVIEDSRDALPAIETGNYDLVLLDVMMPYIDGWQIMRDSREKLLLNLPKIVIMTAQAKYIEGDPKINNGPDAYISKPVIADELWACLEAFAR